MAHTLSDTLMGISPKHKHKHKHDPNFFTLPKHPMIEHKISSPKSKPHPIPKPNAHTTMVHRPSSIVSPVSSVSSAILLALAVLLGGQARAQTQDSLLSKQLEEVIVTGQYEPQTLRQSVYQVRTISSEIIRARNATNIQGVLNTELGIRFSNDLTLGTSEVSIMGMSGRSVKILLDGVPLLDRGDTQESLNQIDLNLVDHIEIVQGPMSVSYGSDALAGVINIITKKGLAENKTYAITARVQEETAGDEYEAMAGKGLHYESVQGQWQQGRWQAGAGVTRNSFGGSQGTAEGREKDWFPKDQWLANAAVGYTTAKLNLGYRLNFLNENLLSEGAKNTNTNIAVDQEYITHRFTHQLQADWAISAKWHFNAAGSYQDYARRTRTTNYNTETHTVRLSAEDGTQDESVFTSSTLRGTFVYRASKQWSLQSGFDLNYTQGMGDRIDKQREIGDYALFVSTEITPWKSVNLRPGARFLYNTAYDAPPVVPSFNLKVNLSPTVDWRVAYARGFRAPALRELYFYFFDSSHAIEGNPDLEAEYSNSYSTSVVWRAVRKPNFFYEATVGTFYNDFKDMISLGIDPNDASQYTYINVDRYKTTGFKINNSVHLTQATVNVGFAYIGGYNEFSEDDASLPEVMWTPEVNTTVTYNVTKTHTTLSAFYKYTGTRATYETDGDDIHLAKIAAYHWLDFTIIQRLSKLLDLSLGIKNALDVVYLKNTSTDTDGAHSTGGPVPTGYGRSFLVGVNFHLSGE